MLNKSSESGGGSLQGIKAVKRKLIAVWVYFRAMRSQLSRVVRSGQVVLPKIKILIAMFQVQGGLITTFQVNLPEAFLQLLQDLNACRLRLARPPLTCHTCLSAAHVHVASVWQGKSICRWIV
jgi:hypothetical protein